MGRRFHVVLQGLGRHVLVLALVAAELLLLPVRLVRDVRVLVERQLAELAELLGADMAPILDVVLVLVDVTQKVVELLEQASDEKKLQLLLILVCIIYIYIFFIFLLFIFIYFFPTTAVFNDLTINS